MICPQCGATISPRSGFVEYKQAVWQELEPYHDREFVILQATFDRPACLVAFLDLTEEEQQQALLTPPLPEPLARAVDEEPF